MAAILVLEENHEHWEVIREFLFRCGGGAIVLGPDACAAMRDRHGAAALAAQAGVLMDYDFGGEPDLMVDWTNDKQVLGYAIQEVDKWLANAAEHQQVG